MMDRNFLVVGVGGQGALLASNILADVGVRAGYDVKKAEVHGMSQRGGSVNSHVRWGGRVRSPVIEGGEVDILLALEKLETLRYLHMLRKDGFVFIGNYTIPPLSVSSGNDQYPDDCKIRSLVEQLTPHYYIVPTLGLAEQAGSTKAHNVVLLGAVSNCLPEISVEMWFEVITEYIPDRYLDLNRNAFLLGRKTGRQ
jgi:indolepyruvate ferredoxin oxidoreductase, beta subunit